MHAAVIAAVAARLGPLTGLSSTAAPWFSATFEGVRHSLTFDAATAPVTDTDLDIAAPRHAVVSLDVRHTGNRTTMDILTVRLS